MATFSSVLGLKLNSQSDPFALADFVANWNILDASPGVFICTSTSRPNWGTSQAGRMIFMTDLKQLSYWTGSAWADLRSSAPIFGGGNYFGNAACNPGSSPVFNVLTFTTSRPSALAIWLTGTYNYPNNKTQDAFQSITFDGVKQMMGGYREQIRFAGNAGDSGSATGINATSMAIIPAISVGQHKIGVQVDVGTYQTAVTLVGVKTMAMIALYASGNTL